jgi:hypothetical protein
VSFRHLVERAQDSETALVQIFLYEGPSLALLAKSASERYLPARNPLASEN